MFELQFREVVVDTVLYALLFNIVMSSDFFISEYSKNIKITKTFIFAICYFAIQKVLKRI